MLIICDVSDNSYTRVVLLKVFVNILFTAAVNAIQQIDVPRTHTPCNTE